MSPSETLMSFRRINEVCHDEKVPKTPSHKYAPFEALSPLLGRKAFNYYDKPTFGHFDCYLILVSLALFLSDIAQFVVYTLCFQIFPIGRFLGCKNPSFGLSGQL